MSLTQVLNMQEIKDAFASAFKRPSFPKATPALVSLRRAKDPSLVGIAFDYLFRSEIGEKLIAKKETDRKQETEFRVIEFLPIAQVGLALLAASEEVSPKIKKAGKTRMGEGANCQNDQIYGYRRRPYID